MTALYRRRRGQPLDRHQRRREPAHRTRIRRLRRRQTGLNHNSVASLTGDREGNLWIGTSGGGVTKLTDRSFSTLSRRRRACRTISPGPCSKARDGTIWIGTQGGGLNRVKDGRVVSVVHDARRPSGGHGDRAARARGRQRVDRDGGRTGASARAAASRSFGRSTSTANSIRALFEARDGALWIGTRARGSRFSGTATSPSGTPRPACPMSSARSTKIPHGTVWVGSDAGLSRYVDGRFETFGVAQGVFRKGVMTISGDPDGTIWAGTYGDGLYRYKDGNVHALLARPTACSTTSCFRSSTTSRAACG